MRLLNRQAINVRIFLQCAHGTAYETACKRGQAYSNEYHRCDYPDSVPDCDSESVVGFKCPTEYELPPNAVARRYASCTWEYFFVKLT